MPCTYAAWFTQPFPIVFQVRIGSLGDPDDLPGLAHFTEHMLFYASEKYPLEDEYSKFVVCQFGYRKMSEIGSV